MPMPPPRFGVIEKKRLPFGDLLSGLCATELSAAKADPERIGEMIERLTNSLAFTIAIAARGEPKGVSEMLEGAAAYLFDAAGSHQRPAELIERLRRS